LGGPRSHSPRVENKLSTEECRSGRLEHSSAIGFYRIMPPLRVIALVALSIGALLSVACGSPANAIRPVIYADDDEAAAAMRATPVILLVRIAGLKMTGDVRSVAKPPAVGGPMVPTIPLHLARINADVLLTVHGQVRTTVEFYSWIWASGSHGGPRLFHPNPGAIRVVFLREEGGYLHTVGDYPSYDLELRSNWLPVLLPAWNSGQESGADPLERLVALRLRAELEGLSENQLREDFGDDGPRVNHHWATDMFDLVRIVGPYFVVTHLDDICHHSRNPSARFAACFVTAQYFPGRCEAYQLARKATTDGFGGEFLAKLFRSCQARDRSLIDDIRSGAPPRFYGSSLAPRHRRETLCVYAAAMDPGVHRVACEVAATTPEARDIPECPGRRDRRTDPPLVHTERAHQELPLGPPRVK
jgi:hypothetical protein